MLLLLCFGPPSAHNFIMDDLSIGSILSLSTISDDTLASDRNNRITACIVTAFPPDTNPRWLYPASVVDPNHLLNFCAKFEICPVTETLHVHYLLHFKHAHRPRFHVLRAHLHSKFEKGVDIKKTKRVSNHAIKCAANYVLKPDDTCSIPPYIWPSNQLTLSFDPVLFEQRPQPDQESKLSLREQQRAWIDSKPRHWNWDQIVHDCPESKALLCACSWGRAYHAGRHAEIPERLIKNVIVFYGAGGTGKTTMAKNYDIQQNEHLNERYYRRNPDDGAFWGGGRTAYKGQRIVHYEEFCGQEQLARLKEICDLQATGPNVNVKNGGTKLNHDTVIFTSNHHPAAWYKNVWNSDAKQFHPFWRRVTQVMFFPSHKPNGELNVPDDHNMPYYIDQTEEWISFNGCYESCRAHADIHWPMREEEKQGYVIGNTSYSGHFNVA